MVKYNYSCYNNHNFIETIQYSNRPVRSGLLNQFSIIKKDNLFDFVSGNNYIMCTDCRDMYSGVRDDRTQNTCQTFMPNLMGDPSSKGLCYFVFFSV
jgi:hypothetical protein